MPNLLILSNKRYKTDFRKYLMQAAERMGGKSMHVYCWESVILSYQGSECETFSPNVDEAVILDAINEQLGSDRLIALTGLGCNESSIATRLQHALKSATFVYDVYDDLTFNATGSRLVELMLQDAIWRSRCEHTIVLDEALKSRYPRAYHLDNASHLQPIAAVAHADQSSMVYIGSIDIRVDFSWLDAIASHDVTISIYGRFHDNAPHAKTELDALLMRHRNVTFHGSYDNDDLSSILGGFRVGLLPYRVGHPMTQHVNPDKLYHYLNAGLEVLAAPIPQALRHAKYVHCVETDGPWETVIAATASAPRRGAWSAAEHSWERRWVELNGYLSGAVSIEASKNYEQQISEDLMSGDQRNTSSPDIISVGEAGNVAVLPRGRLRRVAHNEITLLRNIGLAGEVENLTQQLRGVRPVSRLQRLAAIAEDELISGGWAGRRRFARRILRSFIYRVFRTRIFPDFEISAEQSFIHNPTFHVPQLEESQQAWRRTGIAEAQKIVTDGGDSVAAAAARRAAQIFWSRFTTAHTEARYLCHLKPHGGQDGRLRILVLLGGGGLGDGLMFSPILAALQRHFGDCELTLLFEKSVIVPLYSGNPTVTCAVTSPWSEMRELATAARWLGIFDLFVDILCFLPRYLVCEGSRIDMARYRLWLEGNYRLGDLIDRFSSNLGVTLLDNALNLHMFDLLAGITGLPIDAWSPLIFSPDPKALNAVRALRLPDRYVTIRDGCNAGDLAFALSRGVKRTTKQLPPAKWAQIIEILRAEGVSIVQVGDQNDPSCPGVDIDLRGKTQLSELCFIMKGAVTHIDTEGGLAHFARAINVPAIVFFGTTSASFFGYPSNLNLESSACGRCWYSNATWLAHCPRGTIGPVCTATIDVTTIQRHLPVLIASRQPRSPTLYEYAMFGAEATDLALPAKSLRDWGLACAWRWAIKNMHDGRVPRIAVVSYPDHAETNALGIVTLTASSDDAEADDNPIQGSIYNMPVNDGSYDALLCVDIISQTIEPAAAVTDLLRLVAPSGLLVIATPVIGTSTAPIPASVIDLASLAACFDVSDAAFFDVDGVSASSAALERAGIPTEQGVGWACLGLRPKEGSACC